ncbi:MAG: leucine-rich repeat domain-containing protein [Treponema sp.]|nr:leucine-rich repeat domain-containing protein [Treponema sp.]
MKKFLRTLSLLAALAIFSSTFIACSDDDSGGNNNPSSDLTTTAYTGTFSVGSTAYKTLKMTSDGTYSLKGDSGNDSGTYTVSTESRAVSNGTYIFYSTQSYDGKYFYVVVSDTGIVLQGGTVDASGTGTLRTASDESSGENKGNTTSGSDQTNEESTVDFSDAHSYTVTVSEFAEKVSEIRDAGILKAIFIINDATNENISELKASISSSSFSVKLDLSHSNTLTELPEKAFCKAKSLYFITLPSSLLKIGDRAFHTCKNLHDVSIPTSVTTIEFMAFAECEELESIDIPDSVKVMANDVFSGCPKLTRINIGSGLESIGFTQNIAGGLGKLIEINVVEENPNFTSIDGVLYKKDLTRLIWFPCGKSSVSIPDTVTSFDEGAFWDVAALERLNIPDSVTQGTSGLPNDAPKLTEITIGKGLVGFSGFSNCPKLITINVAEDNQNLKSENNALYSKDGKFLYVVSRETEEFTVSNATTEIYGQAFRECEKLKSVVIPDSVTTIDANAFRGCTKLSNATFEDTESIWYRTYSLTYSDGTEIGSMSTDPAENATKLKANYTYRWYNSKLNSD